MTDEKLEETDLQTATLILRALEQDPLLYIFEENKNSVSISSI